jgi:hypothetical protein
MPSKKKNGKSGSSKTASSSGEVIDKSSTVHCVPTDSHVPPFELPHQPLSSALDPPIVLRLLLSSEKSPDSHSAIAGAYLRCLVTSSVPDDLRTPATVVLLGAQCPPSRADRCWTSFASLVYLPSAPPFPPSFMSRYLKLLLVPPPVSDACAIDIDIPRTFKGDESFSSRVSPEAMRRVLYSYSSYCHELGNGFSYIQGLNTICGLLLFNHGELNAFFLLCAFTMRFAPSHYAHNIAGAHRAASCCDELLKHVDAEVMPTLVVHMLHSTAHPQAVKCISLATRLLLCCACTTRDPGEIVLARYRYNYILNSICSRSAAAGNHSNQLFLFLKRAWPPVPSSWFSFASP